MQPLPGLAAQNRMASRVRPLPPELPEDARESAVLALLFPLEEELNLMLIKRVEDGKPHSGQISFPGGRRDPEDESLQVTALRETFEEVGIPSSSIEVLGKLSQLYIPVSNSNVHPYVGYMHSITESRINDAEVQYILEVPVKELFLPERKTIRHIRPSAFPEMLIKAPAYLLDDDHVIWGATAMMIAELEEVMQSS